MLQFQTILNSVIITLEDSLKCKMLGVFFVFSPKWAGENADVDMIET